MIPPISYVPGVSHLKIYSKQMFARRTQFIQVKHTLWFPFFSVLNHVAPPLEDAQS